MAKERDKREEDIDENEQTEDTQSSGKKKSLLPMIIGIVVALALLGGGGWYFMSNMGSADAAESDGKSEKEDVQITETNIYYSGIPTNIVNLAVSREYEFMYLKYGFDLELSNTKVTSEVSKKLPRIINSVAAVMSNRDWNQICTLQGRDQLAREVMRAINGNLRDGEVIGVYFTTFVAQ